MTAKKKLKQRIRGRMKQTGESYSTARMNLLAEQKGDMSGDDDDETTEDGMKVIRITRAQLLASGDLVDVSATAREAGFNAPMAVTKGAWDVAVKLTESAREAGSTEDLRRWDMCWMAATAVRFAGRGLALENGQLVSKPGAADVSELIFEVMAFRDGPEMETVKLKLSIGNDDAGGPAFTILLPHED